MGSKYYPTGVVLPDLESTRLEYDNSRRLLAACLQHSAFEVVELIRIKKEKDHNVQIIDGIVIECCDGTVPSRNTIGLKNSERLLLLHGPGLITPHEVRALRVNFPVTPHQNHVLSGEPASLCLYFEPWSAVERTWTAAKHLQRILWWLRETALGTLHRSDQPLEQLYFLSPYQIVLPADFKTRMRNQAEVLRLTCVRSSNNGMVLRGVFSAKECKTQDNNIPGLDHLVIEVMPTLVTRIERYPTKLGELHDQLTSRDSGLHDSLVNAVKNAITSAGLQIQNTGVTHTLLLLQVPLVRNADTAPERTDVIGFIVLNSNIANLGIACGAAIDGKDGKAYADNFTLNETITEIKHVPEAWRSLIIEPVDVRVALTPADARKASGISDVGAEFQGVLTGVGALGSCMADLWCRTGWGYWTYIDDDIVNAHNLVRHIAKDMHIGLAKVDVVADMAEFTWPTTQKPVAIAAKVTDLTNVKVKSALENANLLVDATTTLEVPRDLSDLDNSPRMVSTFFTPSGRDSVLLLEDLSRSVRLHTIEAQYYRAILNNTWGEAHLNGHHGSYWVGAGCRDISGVLSHEVVQLHGSTLARQIRLLTTRPDAQIRVWSLNDETGMLNNVIVPVTKTQEQKFGEWRVIWDEGLATKLKSIRTEFLPNETGGVILGYVDQKRKAVHLVDALRAPLNSIASQSEFIRGDDGVKESIERAADLTANIVGYLGEWHSHPHNSSANPSSTDTVLLDYLAHSLALDCLPALMIIVSEKEISISLKKDTLHE